MAVAFCTKRKHHQSSIFTYPFGGAFPMLTPRVHQCEFCCASFSPRPQVKNPRACGRAECQGKRQRSNELAWRQRNNVVNDPEYHLLCKRARLERLGHVSERMSRCLSTGATFLNEKIPLELMRDLLFQFLRELGIRRVNKFWPDVFIQAEQHIT